MRQSFIEQLLKIPPAYSGKLPFTGDIDQYLFERYHHDAASWKRLLYYQLKPFIPRSVQLLLRRKYQNVQVNAQTFPAWPIEPLLVDRINEYLDQLRAAAGTSSIPHVPFWPNDAAFAFVITHDVEWDSGLRNAHRLAEIEKELGFTSSWNIVPERYPIDFSIIDNLRADGFEIGIHGLKHDGKLFQSRSLFEKRLKKIHEYAKEWGARGFRSPSTLRNAEWMEQLEFEYDSSFPDTDPYEPQSGGCCSIWPYFIGNVVELPLTLPQDHTIFEILGRNDIELWKQKVEWIEAHHGIAVLNVHPDYMIDEQRLGLYRDFLIFMKQRQSMWHVLPLKAAQWWRRRAGVDMSHDLSQSPGNDMFPDIQTGSLHKI